MTRRRVLADLRQATENVRTKRSSLAAGWEIACASRWDHSRTASQDRPRCSLCLSDPLLLSFDAYGSRCGTSANGGAKKCGCATTSSV